MFHTSDLPTLHRMQAAARRIQLMIHARACKEYALAFGHHANSNSATLDMCVIHNSIVSLENGKPWQEVNYSHMRRARWLCDQSYKLGITPPLMLGYTRKVPLIGRNGPCGRLPIMSRH